ncbi:sigma-70 family RNA polymerase sigma factor [Pseudomonas sp. RIT-PI-AD]|uniref:sigma-70 family RNA polymerase sigma factor n=1 Tax=Pseudomonas sp. RIT-PI-AD TaxID=3035294 RepID=UPI0021D869E0|nr:sigma-70 family RNA polymerase sigma factor [Pseudomonas sp. RIT-PI-AD]
MDNYYRELVKFLTTTLGDRHLAADVAHDAYLRVLERSSQVVIEQPRAFLYRTAINISIDLHRRNQARPSESIDVLDCEDQCPGSSPHHSLYRDQRLALVNRALAELSGVCREAFLLRKLEGLSHPVISERLGISKDMVEKHIVNAMKHCRMRMREWES